MFRFNLLYLIISKNNFFQSSPFKRQLSLRLNDLPSNLERTRSMSLDNSASLEEGTNNSLLNNNHINQHEPEQPG